jgi:hypothetical protein
MNGMYGINLTGRPCEAGVVGPAPALELPYGLIGYYHRALHNVTDRRSFGAESC